MDIFASDRIKPENVKFPKGFDKITWTHVSSYKELCAKAETNPIGTVVLDTGASDPFNALKCAKAITEITCDKHVKLPTIIVVGPNTAMKQQVEDHISSSKKWVDISRGAK